MTLRRTLVGLIAVLATLAVVGAGTLGWAVLRQRSAAPAKLILMTATTLTVLDQSGGGSSPLATDANTGEYRFPAVAPSGRQIAYIAEHDGSFSILRVLLSDGSRTELYRSAVNRPFNLAWSPDGRYVNFLLMSQNGLTLHVVPADGSQPAQLIAAGFPSYYAWRADSSALLLHIEGHAAAGGRLETYTPGQTRTTPLLANPGLFQAPAWSVDGQHIYYVAQPQTDQPVTTYQETTAQLVRVTAEGKDPQPLVTEAAADVRMVRSPITNQLGYIAGKIAGPRTLSWGPLKLVDGLAGGEPRTLSRPDEHVGAFFWSPDGARIAYLSYQERAPADAPRTLHIVELATGKISDLTTFAPSEAQAELETFFDAYLFGINPWSPDSKRLAYGTDGGVFVADAVVGGEPQRAGDGLLGLWVGGAR